MGTYPMPMPMPQGWFQVAWSDEVPRGGSIPHYYFVRHLVAWRDDSGEAHVWDAFCPHRVPISAIAPRSKATQSCLPCTADATAATVASCACPTRPASTRRRAYAGTQSSNEMAWSWRGIVRPMNPWHGICTSWPSSVKPLGSRRCFTSNTHADGPTTKFRRWCELSYVGGVGGTELGVPEALSVPRNIAVSHSG